MTGARRAALGLRIRLGEDQERVPGRRVRERLGDAPHPRLPVGGRSLGAQHEGEQPGSGTEQGIARGRAAGGQQRLADEFRHRQARMPLRRPFGREILGQPHEVRMPRRERGLERRVRIRRRPELAALRRPEPAALRRPNPSRHPRLPPRCRRRASEVRASAAVPCRRRRPS